MSAEPKSSVRTLRTRTTPPPSDVTSSGSPRRSPGLPDALRVPGSPGWSYLPGIGVWSTGRDGDRVQVLDWCPQVTRHLATLNPRGEVVGRLLTLAVGEMTATVSSVDVADHKVWRNRFPGVPGVGSRTTREILHNIIDAQARMLPLGTTHAHWADDELRLPPLDVLPAGYGATRGTKSSFTALLKSVAQSPLMSLVMGSVVAGLFVDPLGRQSFMVHLNCPSSRGKTTALQASAAIVGLPGRGGVIEPWTGTANGLIVWLRALAVLPGFRDEIQALGLRPNQLQQMVFAALEGARKMTSTREGNLNQPVGGWSGVLLSTGNEGIVTRIPNVGIAARVIEINKALTVDSRQSKTIKRLATMGHGHGLAEIMHNRFSPLDFAEMIGAAEGQLQIPDGGPQERVGEHIASCVAGAQLLAQMFGVVDLAEAALAGGRETLGDQVEGMAERGGGEGGTLLAGVAEWEMSEPTRFPTRPEYQRQIDEGRPRIEVAGWDVRGAEGIAADLAVLPGKLRGVAEDLGISDVTTALQELDRLGHLLRAPGKLNYPLRVGGKLQRVYLFRNVHPVEDVDTDTLPAPVMPAPEAPAPEAADALTVTDEKLPCIRCGTPTVVRIEGKPEHAGCEAPERPAERPALRLVQPEIPLPDGYLSQWLTENGHPGAAREDLAAAESLWLSLMRGVPFRGPFDTAKRLLNGGLKHHSIPALPDHDRNTVLDAVQNRWRSDTWMVPGEELAADAGQWVNSFDVNGMYPAAAEIELGLGDPKRFSGSRLPDRWQKLPGYVQFTEAPRGLPNGLDGRLRDGAWVPVPMVSYWADSGAELHIGEALLWEEHGRRLRSHAGMYRNARRKLIEMGAMVDGRLVLPVPAELVLVALKAVANRMFGAWLRSTTHNKTETLRVDWSDMIVATAQSRMLRAVDKCAARLVGVHVDACWFIGDHAGEIPHGLQVPDDLQLGKFKPHGSAPVTAELVDAYRVQRWKPFFEALEAGR